MDMGGMRSPISIFKWVTIFYMYEIACKISLVDDVHFSSNYVRSFKWSTPSPLTLFNFHGIYDGLYEALEFAYNFVSLIYGLWARKRISRDEFQCFKSYFCTVKKDHGKIPYACLRFLINHMTFHPHIPHWYHTGLGYGYLDYSRLTK